MDNIFTHDITPGEKKVLDKMTPGRNIDEKIIYENSLDSDLIYADLFRLYCIRDNKQKAMEFFDKIKDPTHKHFLLDF